MIQEITETEQRVIDILASHPVTGDAQVAPIHAVDRAMGWGTAETRQFVDGLVECGLIHFVPVVTKGPIYDPKSFWKAGPRANMARIVHARTLDGDALCGKDMVEISADAELLLGPDWNGVSCALCNAKREFPRGIFF